MISLDYILYFMMNTFANEQLNPITCPRNLLLKSNAV